LLALRINRAVCVLPVPDASTLVRQLGNVQQLLDSGIDVVREPTLVPGRRVRICHGPLMGLEGAILRRQGTERLIVAVDFLQQGASVELSVAYLEDLG
jgi:transcription antitermination factor NusG